MIGHSAHIKKGALWAWRPLRLEGQNVIAVYHGARLALLLGPHEVDAAWALVTLRNLAAAAPVRLLRSNGHKAIAGAEGGDHGR